MRQKLLLILYLTLVTFTSNKLKSQCQNFNVNLTGVPDTVWTSPNIPRNGQCCGANSNTECLSFTVTLDPNTVGVWFYMTGAPALGSEFYQINCGETHSMRDTICLSGVGPHNITFCKPGNNPNTYIIEAIAKPTFPSSEITRIGCSKKIQTYGMMPGSISWTSISPGNSGDYNSYLSCLTCASPVVTPASNAPDSVDYVVCGDPIATMCGFNLRVCDTVRVYFKDALGGSVPGNPFSFCNYGINPGVLINGSASGGDGNYTYYWFNSDSLLLSDSSSVYATLEDDYILEIRDGLISSSCPSYFTGASVSVGELPIVNAGTDQKVCASSPTVHLNGSIQYASAIWSSTGTGSFSPNNTILNPYYTPSFNELNSGYSKLILSSSTSGNCPIQKDTVVIYYSDTMKITFSSSSLNCYNDSVSILSSVSFGTAPFYYLWNTNETTSSIVDGSGVYYLTVTDSVGCKKTESFSLTSPSQLNLVTASTDVSTPFGSDGTASVNIMGGTPSYSVLWMPGALTTASINGLTNGIYQVTVTDSKGCISTSSVVVDDPRCSGFTAVSTNDILNCFGDSDGSLTVSASGGTSPYTYYWNPVGGSSSTASGLSAGTYMVFVQDASGCIAQANGTVSEPSLLNTVISHTDATSVGANNGTAQVIVSGGSPSYSYVWSHGPATSFVSGLAPALYHVITTDNKGCSKRDSVLIVDPPCNNLIASVNTAHVSCFGGNTGSAVAFVAQGTAPYLFNWSNGATGTSITNLQAGNYSLIVKDANNCSELISFTITQPSKLSTTVTSTSASCNGFTDGSVELNVSGGTFPYAYTWSNSSTAQDLFAVASGTYSVTVTDFNGCSSNAVAIVSNPSPLVATYSVNPVLCYGAGTGSIDLTVSGGTPSYTYSWSNGSTTQDLSGISAGFYVVNVTDGNNCKLTKPLSIEITQNDSIKIDSVKIACTAPSNGLAPVAVFASGGVQPYQYSYINGNYQTSNLFNLPAGNYLMRVKDSNACLISAPKPISIDPIVSISASSFLKCFDSPTDSSFINVLPSGGDGGSYQVSFNGGLNFLNYGIYGDSVSIGTIHQIIVRDSSGCSSLASSFSIPSAFLSTLADISDYNSFGVSCKGSTDGFVQTSIQGGTTPYTYSWTNGSLSQNLINISAGTYSLLITDANLCTETFTVTLTEPDKLRVTAEVISDYHGSPISCFGASDGSLQATGSGGAPAYSFSWSNGQHTAIATGISAASYTVSISDLNNCTADTSIIVVGPSVVTATVSVLSNYNGFGIRCFGDANGSLLVSANGGTGAYSYTWSTGDTISAVSNLVAGTYSVVVKDSNNCSFNASGMLTQPQKLSTQLSIVSDYNGADVSCFGASDGSASVVANGGVLPYTYLWSNSDTDSVNLNLSSGWYSVQVLDKNTCIKIDSIYLSQPDSFKVFASVLTDFNGYGVSCFGYDDGSVGVITQGGTGQPDFLWSNGSTSAILNGLPSNSFSVLAIDDNGCSNSDTIILTQPLALTLSTNVLSDYNGSQVSCYGYSDGSAFVNVSGGVPAYSISWSNGQTGNTAQALSAGTYTVSVIDLNSCPATSVVALVNPPILTANASVISNYGGFGVSCSGDSNGTITVSVSGGTGSIEYSWSNGLYSQTISGLSAGTYSVVVRDTNQCTTNSVVVLTEPNPIQLSMSVDSDYNGSPISCFGASDGAVSAIATGGVGSFTYIWSNGINSSQNTNLLSGWYFVMVRDSNQCTRIDSILLAEPDPVFVSINVLSDYSGYGVSCFGSANGSAMAIVSGGVGAVTYLWSNGSVSNVVSGLSSGAYTVSVTDQNNCSDNSIIYITQPPQLLNSIDSISSYNGFNISCFGASNGFVQVNVTGGVAPYAYLWSNLQTSNYISGLSYGSYQLTTSDANGCIDTTLIYLSQPPAITLLANVTDVLCNGKTDGAIDLFVSGGVFPYSFLWSNGSTSEDISSLPANGYVVWVNDANSCQDTLSIKVSENKPLKISSVISDVKCNGDSSGAINLTIAGGFPPYTSIWNTGDTLQDLNSLISGSYMVSIIDYLGCKDSVLFILSQPDSMSISSVVSNYYTGTNISAPGAQDGYVDVSISGGTLPYEFTWSNGTYNEDISGVGAGYYTVIVNDSNGCKLTRSFQLNEPFVLEMPTGITPNSDGKNDFFVIRGIEVYPDNTLTIFNRWGNIVYQKKNYSNQWNGTNNSGDELPDGTYYVVMNINDGQIVLTNYVDLRKH